MVKNEKLQHFHDFLRKEKEKVNTFLVDVQGNVDFILIVEVLQYDTFFNASVAMFITTFASTLAIFSCSLLF